MPTITTTTDTKALEWPGSSLMDYKSAKTNGSSFICVVAGTSINIYYQDQSTGAWAASAGLSTTRAGLQEVYGFFVDRFHMGHLAYRVSEGGKDRTFYRRVNLESTPNAFGTELLIGEASNGGVAGSVTYGGDIIAVSYGSECRVVVAIGGQYSAGNHNCNLYAIKIATGSAFPSTQSLITSTAFTGARSWVFTGTGYFSPSLDFQHTGDAHSSATPHLWLTMGRNRVHLAKLTFASGRWTGSSSVTTLTSAGVATDYQNSRWDGARHLTSFVLSASPDAVTVYERNSANTATTIRTTPVHPQGNIRARAINYDQQSKDIRVWAVGTTTGQLYYVDFVRATGLWGAWAQVSATALQDVQSWGVRRGTSGRSRHDLYWEPASASPYTLTHVEQLLSFPPATPRITAPMNGQAADVGDPLTFHFTFSDPDPGATMGSFALSRQVGVGAVQYWNVGTGLWQGTEVMNVSATPSVTLPGTGWGAESDAVHTYKVKVADNDGLQSAYSDPLVVIPSTWTVVTITTPAAGGVVASDRVSPVWTVSEQQAVSLRLMKTFDAFGRTTASGWGTSTNGAVWTVSGGVAADYSTGNDGSGLFVGTMSLGSVNVARRALADATSSASDVAMDLRCPVTPTGAPIVSSLIMWYDDDNNYWRADVEFRTNGTVWLTVTHVAAGTTWTDGGPVQVYATHVTSRWYTVRMSYVNGRIRAKLWDINEPNYWHIDVAHDAFQTHGRIGARAIANTGNTNGTQLMRFDNIRRPTLDKVYDSGWVQTTETDAEIPTSLPDLSSWTLDVQVMNNERNIGRTATRHFTVDYVEPPVATLVVTAVPGVGALRLTITNPAPGGGQPAFASNEVWRKINGETDLEALRFAFDLAEDAVWDDNRAVSGVDYLYKVRTYGANGTRIDTAWT